MDSQDEESSVISIHLKDILGGKTRISVNVPKPSHPNGFFNENRNNENVKIEEEKLESGVLNMHEIPSEPVSVIVQPVANPDFDNFEKPTIPTDNPVEIPKQVEIGNMKSEFKPDKIVIEIPRVTDENLYFLSKNNKVKVENAEIPKVSIPYESKKNDIKPCMTNIDSLVNKTAPNASNHITNVICNRNIGAQVKTNKQKQTKVVILQQGMPNLINRVIAQGNSQLIEGLQGESSQGNDKIPTISSLNSSMDSKPMIVHQQNITKNMITNPPPSRPAISGFPLLGTPLANQVFTQHPYNIQKAAALSKSAVDGHDVQTRRYPAKTTHANTMPVQILPAAPYPALPNQSEIIEIINSLDNEIDSLQSHIHSLIRERDLGAITVPSISERDPINGIQNYFGFLMPQNCIKTIIEKNQKKAMETHQKNALSCNNFRNGQYFNHISHHYMFSFKDKDNNTFDTMMRTISNSRRELRSKAVSLAHEYKKRRTLWNNFSDNLRYYQKEQHETVEVFPPEFVKTVRRIGDRMNTQLWAPDQPMYLSEQERETYLLYDENCFVSDPLLEHYRFKDRVSWTESDKKLFIEKYAQHPRDFKKIANSIPSKTVKDVVEYYYINRKRLDLKGVEAQSKKRGRKKYITEGGVK